MILKVTNFISRVLNTSEHQEYYFHHRIHVFQFIDHN